MSDNLDLYRPVDLTAFSVEERSQLLSKVMEKAFASAQAGALDLDVSKISMRIDATENPKLAAFLEKEHLSGQYLSDEYAFIGFKALEVAAAQGLEGKVTMSVSLSSSLGAPSTDVRLSDLKGNSALEAYGNAFAHKSHEVFNNPSSQNMPYEDFEGKSAVILHDHYENFIMQATCQETAKNLNKLLIEDPQKVAVLKTFEARAKAAFSQELKKNDDKAQQISDERLMLISEPVLRTGTIRNGSRAGQPYYMVEINACKTIPYGSKEKPSFYKLAVFGDKKSSEHLTSMVRRHMKVCVSGLQSEKTYLNAKGEEFKAKRITVDDFSLEPVQPGLNKLSFDKSAVPEHFSQSCALYQANDGFIPRQNDKYERADALQMQVMQFKAGQQEVIPDHGPYAKRSCRDVELLACGMNGKTPGFYYLRAVIPVANALLMEKRFEVGLALRVSGNVRQSGELMSGKRTHPVFEGSINHISIDLKQHALEGIDFDVHPRAFGVPESFKGNPEDYFKGREPRTEPTTSPSQSVAPKVAQGMER